MVYRALGLTCPIGHLRHHALTILEYAADLWPSEVAFEVDLVVDDTLENQLHLVLAAAIEVDMLEVTTYIVGNLTTLLEPKKRIENGYARCRPCDDEINVKPTSDQDPMPLRTMIPDPHTMMADTPSYTDEWNIC